MLNTLMQETRSEKNSILSNSSSHLKLIRRTSKSKSLKIKRSDSQSSLQQSFPNFFVKKVPKFNSKNNDQEFETLDVTPIKVIKRKSEHAVITQKKRQPTPVKSYREISETLSTLRKPQSNQLNLQKEMEIHQLEKKLQSQAKIRSMYQQRAKKFENEVSIQARKVKSLEKQLEIAKEKQCILKERIQEIEVQLDVKNHDLKNTKSNLEKLKENIKQVRNQEYQSQIKKVSEEIIKYKNLTQEQNNHISSLKNENTALKMQIARIKTISEQNKLKTQQENKTHGLIKEIQSLKIQLTQSSTQKQQFLEHKLFDMHKQVNALKKINQSKLIEIDFLNRKKHEELEILRQRKSDEIKALRIKFAALMDEYKSLKHKKHETKSKDQRNNKSTEKKSVEKRQNRFACPTTKERYYEEDQLCFSLSPDVK